MLCLSFKFKAKATTGTSALHSLCRTVWYSSMAPTTGTPHRSRTNSYFARAPDFFSVAGLTRSDSPIMVLYPAVPYLPNHRHRKTKYRSTGFPRRAECVFYHFVIIFYSAIERFRSNLLVHQTSLRFRSKLRSDLPFHHFCGMETLYDTSTVPRP